jgi:hypothetical protein
MHLCAHNRDSTPYPDRSRNAVHRSAKLVGWHHGMNVHTDQESLLAKLFVVGAAAAPVAMLSANEMITPPLISQVGLQWCS